MTREEEIQFLDRAKARAEARAREWHAHQSVKAAAKGDYLNTLQLIKEAKKVKARG
ncbi:hypothetical protein [Rhodomicrobium lacus]|uniref:hypothetical protein n=1 Tax=Rhodomicrobium lacus TaxID=2498452 RepID=UPI0013DF551C|nr:hypothetical protein [Rhodomicrobium lacus]